MHEVAVGGAVRRHHVNVRFRDGDRVRDLRQQDRHAGSQQDAELAPCHQSAGLVLLSIFLKMVLIAHIPSLSTLLDARHSKSTVTLYTDSLSSGWTGLCRPPPARSTAVVRSTIGSAHGIGSSDLSFGRTCWSETFNKIVVAA